MAYNEDTKSLDLFLEAMVPFTLTGFFIGGGIGRRFDAVEIPKLAAEKITFIKGEIAEIKENHTNLNIPYSAVPEDSLKTAFTYNGQDYVSYNAADQITPQDRINEKQELIASLEANPANHFPQKNTEAYGIIGGVVFFIAFAVYREVNKKFRDNVENITDKFNKGVVKAVKYPFRKKPKNPEIE